MEIKIIKLDNNNAAIKIFTEHSDICVISNIEDLSEEGKKELYNSKWIVNCPTLDDYNETIKLAKELRPKQLFIMDISTQIDEFSKEALKSWRGDILKSGDSLELTDKADEGIFLEESQWIYPYPTSGSKRYFELDKRYRIEGRKFILCIKNLAYGELKIGKIANSEDKGKFKYQIEEFEPFEEQKLLEIPSEARKDIFVNHIENYYFENQLKSISDEELKAMSRQDWIDAWKKDPHWANSMEPSSLAEYFVTEIKREKLTGTILEIGSGNGRDSIYFGKHGYDVTGIDISPDATKIANENNDLSNVKFQVGDAERLPFKDNSFDAVYSLSVLHSTDLEKSIKELSRVLDSGGLSVLYLYNKSIYPDEEEINFKITDLEKIFTTNELQILDKWRDKIEDEDGEKHIHHLVIYLLKRK